MTGLRMCDTRSHVASELAGWRADDDVGGVASGQCSRPVPALTCAAGNCGVRSSGKKPKRSRSIRERRRGEDRTGEREWTPADASLPRAPADGMNTGVQGLAVEERHAAAGESSPVV